MFEEEDPENAESSVEPVLVRVVEHGGLDASLPEQHAFPRVRPAP